MLGRNNAAWVKLAQGATALRRLGKQRSSDRYYIHFTDIGEYRVYDVLKLLIPRSTHHGLC